MKQIKGYRLWQIIYPVGIYYVVSSVVFLFAGMLFGNANETYMLRQTLCALVTIPFLYFSFYRKDRQLEKIVMDGKEKDTATNVVKYIICAVIGTGTLGIACNNLIAMTPLMQVSSGYQETNQAFFGGGMVFEILGSGLLIPIAEEMLFRGIVFKRLRIWAGVRVAIAGSALFFALIHVNLVQFLYAGILGIFLALLLEKSGKLYIPVLGHITANLIAIVRAETGWLSFAYQITPAGIGVTAGCLLVAGCIVWVMTRER